MRKSTNYEMNLLDEDDFYTEEQFNENTEKIDEVLKNLEEPEHDATKQTEVEELESGESIKVALRKLAKAVKALIDHLTDNIIHITSEERTLWNTVKDKADSNHTHNYAGSSTPGGAATKAINDNNGNDIAAHIESKNKPHSIKIGGGGAYCHKVIGLIKLDGSYSYSYGEIEFLRSNGVTAPLRIIFEMQSRYNITDNFWCDYIAFGEFEILKPCIFSYNGVQYAGFYFYCAPANHDNILFDIKKSNMTPFLIDMYNTSTSAILNSEISSSLKINNYSEGSKITSNGKRILRTSDLVKNLTTTTEGLPLDAAMGKILQDSIDSINTKLAKEEIIELSIPKVTVANGTVIALKEYMTAISGRIIGCEIIGAHMSNGPGGVDDGDYYLMASSVYISTSRYMYIGGTENLLNNFPKLVIRDTGLADSKCQTLVVTIRVTYAETY